MSSLPTLHGWNCGFMAPRCVACGLVCPVRQVFHNRTSFVVQTSLVLAQEAAPVANAHRLDEFSASGQPPHRQAVMRSSVAHAAVVAQGKSCEETVCVWCCACMRGQVDFFSRWGMARCVVIAPRFLVAPLLPAAVSAQPRVLRTSIATHTSEHGRPLQGGSGLPLRRQVPQA